MPSGFVVGAPAYDEFVTHSGLRDRVAERLAGLDVDDAEALRRAADEVRAMVAAAPIPESVETELRQAYPDLGAQTAVAVRSSATAEDTEAASFAGMNEILERPWRRRRRRGGASLLGVPVRRAHGLLPAKRRFGQADMDIAVVVQRQLDIGSRRRDVRDRPVERARITS